MKSYCLMIDKNRTEDGEDVFPDETLFYVAYFLNPNGRLMYFHTWYLKEFNNRVKDGFVWL